MEFIAAIDLGSSKIVSILGKQNESGKLELVAISKTESKGIKRGMIQSIEDTTSEIIQTINEIQEKSGFNLTEVVVGTTGHHISCSRNRGLLNLDSPEHEINEGDLKKLTQNMFKIHTDLQDEDPAFYDSASSSAVFTRSGNVREG